MGSPGLGIPYGPFSLGIHWRSYSLGFTGPPRLGPDGRPILGSNGPRPLVSALMGFPSLDSNGPLYFGFSLV